MNITDINKADHFSDLLSKGYELVPVERGGKKPLAAWGKNKSIDEAVLMRAIEQGANIGVILGAASGGLVDIDLDCPEAVKLAPYFLPATGLIFGRETNPHSHWIYRVSGNPGTRKAFSQGGMIAEYRADGCYTVFPPSIHQTGESYRYHSDGDPAVVDPEELVRACATLAGAVLLVRNWREGQRHEMTLALSGTLLRGGWNIEEVAHLVEAVCSVASDPEPDDRLRAVDDTQKKLDTNGAVSGWQGLQAIVGTSVAKHLADWLLGSDVALHQGDSEPQYGEHTGSPGPTLGHNGGPSSIQTERNDATNAQRFWHAYREDLRYCEPFDGWLKWAGGQWELVSDDRVVALAEKAARQHASLVVGDGMRSREEVTWANQSLNRRQLEAAVKLSRAYFETKAEDFDQNKFLVSVKNGTLDLCTGELRAHSRADMITRILPVMYDRNAQAPIFQGFLSRIFAGNQDLISFVKRLFGYALTGSTEAQCFFIFYGSGANGKSTLQGVMSELFGPYYLKLAMETLLAKRNGDANTYDLARCRGARLMFASESESNQRLAQARMKELTGGEQITVRQIYGQHFQMTLEAKIILASNYLPQIDGSDMAMLRRIHMVPFDVVIPPEERDPKLQDKLRAELPGILNWVLEGCLEWQSIGGLNPPEIVRRATESYATKYDPIRRFAQEQIVDCPTGSVTVADMYWHYQEWCSSENVICASKKAFSERLKALNFLGKKKNEKRSWIGISIRSSSE
jgi:putative DNA primase/helicase